VDWIINVTQQPAGKVGQAPAPDTPSSDVEHRAIALRAKKDWPGLVKLGQQWLRNTPENVVAWGTLGEAYSHLGQHNQALAARRKVVARQPEDAEAWHNLGATYSELGRHSEARSAFQKALQLRTILAPEAIVTRFGALQQAR
jgi:tetratricopeptide (TPR) repeat protein